MTKVHPLDLLMVALENSNRAFHMTGWLLLEPPARQKNTFVPRLVETYRNSAVGKPFNQKLVSTGPTSAAWEEVEVDMTYHVRHIAVPAPGSMKQFYELISFLNAPLLDRAYPLWDCYVIEGLEDGRCAVMLRVHHALFDGAAGLQVLRGGLSDKASDKRIKPFWRPSGEKNKKKRPRTTQSQAQQFLSRFSDTTTGLIDMATGLVKVGAKKLQNLDASPVPGALAQVAPKTVFNTPAISSARRYANSELPLDRIKAVAKATGCSVNDVAMTFIDDALHRYLREQNQEVSRPLSVLMPLSFRNQAHGNEGNQVSMDVVPLGEPDASLLERLQQVHRASREVKSRNQSVPTGLRQVYTLFLAGRATLLQDISPLFNDIPVANLTVSNMAGPQEQLYLGGGRLVAFHGLPIVPPGIGLNVTFASVNQDICLGVGAIPEAMDDPFRLTELIQDSFKDLETQVLAKKSAAKKSRRRKA